MQEQSSVFDTVIRGSRIVFEHGMRPGCVAVRNGRIEMIGERNLPCEAKTVIDAGNAVVLPGVVDPHVHFKDPGVNNFREDFASGTRQAAAGGVTTVMEMPYSIPPVTDAATFEAKRMAAEAQAVTDFALWGSLSAKAAGHYADMARLGSVAFKVFLCADPSGEVIGDYDLLRSMETLAAMGALVGVHAENADITARLTELLRKQGKNGGAAHAAARPEIAELEAIERVLLFAEHTGCRLHICHLTTAAAREMLRTWRARGVDVTVETALPYLMLDSNDLIRLGGHAKCGPPLRSSENRQTLWDMARCGEIDMIVSDHCPFLDAEREQPVIFDAPSGLSGLDVLLPLVIDEGVHRQGIGFEDIARLMASAPAKRFGVYPRKGALRPGADADLAIVDPDREWTFTWQHNFGKSHSKKTPYEGRVIKGKVLTTMVRGTVVYENGEITVPSGFGMMLRPATALP